MPDRILFIDDDRTLLNTFQRNLQPEFEVDIAEGFPQARSLVESGNVYSVMVVDMRMPGYDGIETINKLRELTPDSVYIMLTGNQDVSTAMQAVNEASVFQFMNKPCEMDDMRQALNAAQNYYNEQSSQREVLDGTFAGSIGFMSDIVEMQSTGLIDTNRFSTTMDQIGHQMGLQISWDERIAARLALAGTALLSAEERTKLFTLAPNDPEHTEIVSKLCDASARMVERIPRLAQIAKILRHIPKVDGWISVSLAPDLISATLLRVTLYWNLLIVRGVPGKIAAQEIKLLMPNCTETLVNALSTLDDQGDLQKPVQLHIEELREGMVFYEDILDEWGALIVSRGRRLTLPILEKLRFRNEQGKIDFVKVVEGSCIGMIEA